MKLKLTKYRTFTGIKEVVEIPDNNYGQFVVYQNKKPKFLINCFDFKHESNQILNGLLLSKGKSISEVLQNINKLKNTKLSVERAPLIEIQVATEMTEINLKPLPLEWLN